MTYLRGTPTLILKRDGIYGEMLRDIVLQIDPDATISVETSIRGATARLAVGSAKLLIAGVSFPDGDLLDELSKWKKEISAVGSVFITTSHKESHVIECLREIGVRSFFDSETEGSTRLRLALETTLRGGSYWSESVQTLRRRNSMLLPRLTPRLRTVLALAGSGVDPRTAAEYLGLQEGTVRRAHEELHRVLGFKHRGELQRFALEHGYARSTGEGTIRPGFKMLLAACAVRKAPKTAVAT